MIIKATKKPILVEAILWDGTNLTEVRDFCTLPYFYKGINNVIEVLDKTQSKWSHVNVGDVIVRGVRGELYSMSPLVFKDSYDILEGSLS